MFLKFVCYWCLTYLYKVKSPCKMTVHSRTVLTNTVITKQNLGADLIDKWDLIEMLRVTLSVFIKVLLYLLDFGFMSQLKIASVSACCRLGF